MNFGTKNASIEFDESVISAQEIARALSDTPHMMDGNMQYGGSLVLGVAGLKDDATTKKTKDTLGKVEGVAMNGMVRGWLRARGCPEVRGPL